MKFKELIENVELKELMEYLFQTNFNSSVDSLGIMKLYENLKQSDPINSDTLKLYVMKCKDVFEEDSYFNVCAFDTEDKSSYAIEFTPWGEWLGFDVVQKSLDMYGEACFVCECLKEMSFLSFNEDEIQDQFQKLLENCNSISDFDESYEKMENFFMRYAPDESIFDESELTPEEEEAKRARAEKALIYNENLRREILSDYL